jgi:acyl carrier protein
LSDPETVILDTIRMLLERRGEEPTALRPDADLYQDLELDSLEIAELSVVLEDEFGTDPYTSGLVPRTVIEVVEFYNGSP